ncbi:unnamed protein product [Linum tenue]|uniref:Uncharacterized protein n=1 Tax=Linum tenue TaxID=586396 RepID=A0AAV0IKV8_9ROSI|nr:unnamed protein product [Linum tenue]
MEPEEVTSSAARRRLSCTKHFDALWFCYCTDLLLPSAPVHQMQQYYRLGVLDNCSGKWSALYDCLTLKTKRSSEIEVSFPQISNPKSFDSPGVLVCCAL